jgi:ABC-type microcin C transport system permease subunit YejE
MAVLIVVFDALALALVGTRTVAAYSLSGEITSLISISYLALGLGMGRA